MVLMATPICDFGKKAIDFKLPGVDGKKWSLTECAGENGTLLMFLSNHCPYVKAIQNRLVEDTLQLLDLGIKSVAIMSNDATEYPEDSFENMIKVSKTFNYPFPFLFDETQETARAYDAICTPDFLVTTVHWNYNTVVASMPVVWNHQQKIQNVICSRR